MFKDSLDLLREIDKKNSKTIVDLKYLV